MERLNEKKNLKERFFQSCERIRWLLFIQMGDKLRKKDGAAKKHSAFLLFLKLLAIVAICAALTAVCYFLKNKFYVPLDRDMLAAMLFITQIASVVSMSGSVGQTLFADKENQILLTFPCSFWEISASKLLLLYLRELKRNCYFLLPFLIGFGIITGCGAGFYISFPFAYLLLSALPIFIACAVSVLTFYIKRALQARAAVYSAWLVLVFALIFLGVNAFLGILPNPLRLLQKYGSYIQHVSLAISGVAEFSLYYSSRASIMWGGALALDSVILIASSAAVVGGGLAIIFPFYFRAVSASGERAGEDKKAAGRKRGSSGEGGSLYLAFLKKELLLTVRDTARLSSVISSFLVLPIVSYTMNFLLDAINTNPLGDYMIIAFNLMISASLIAAFNTDCASALSAEGLEFAVLKTAPSNTMVIAWAKITVTLSSNFIAIALTAVMLYFTTEINLTNLSLIILSLILIAAGIDFWSFQLDVRRPQFAEYAAKGSSGVVDNPNVGLATLYGFIAATLAGALSLLLLYDDYATGWLRFIAIAAGFAVARAFLLYRNLQVYFHEIEL